MRISGKHTIILTIIPFSFFLYIFFLEDIVAFVVINLCKIAIARLCDVCLGVPALHCTCKSRDSGEESSGEHDGLY